MRVHPSIIVVLIPVLALSGFYWSRSSDTATPPLPQPPTQLVVDSAPLTPVCGVHIEAGVGSIAVRNFEINTAPCSPSNPFVTYSAHRP